MFNIPMAALFFVGASVSAVGGLLSSDTATRAMWTTVCAGMFLIAGCLLVTNLFT